MIGCVLICVILMFVFVVVSCVLVHPGLPSISSYRYSVGCRALLLPLFLRWLALSMSLVCVVFFFSRAQQPTQVAPGSFPSPLHTPTKDYVRSFVQRITEEIQREFACGRQP